MTRHLPSYRRARGEDGVALAWALAFMVLIGVVVFFVLGYVTTSVRSSKVLASQRSDVYAADGAINQAIQYARNNGNAGVAGAGGGCTTNTQVNQLQVTVECAPTDNSGTASAPSSAPPFAVLTLAPFTEYWDAHGFTNGGSYPGCSSVSTAAGAELGIVQVQNDKALTINGDVYVNSDVDADTWSGSCPNYDAARAIQVNGNAIVHEGCHDLFAASPFAWYCDRNGQTDNRTQQVAGRTPTGGFSAAPAALAANLKDPAIANPSQWAPEIATAPPARSVPPCPADPKNLIVAFDPGTYTDAAGLSNLMNGTTCPGHLFWFKPGSYYFNFNNNSSLWSINDGAARIVGGTPTAVSSGSVPQGPFTLNAVNPPAPTTGYAPTTNPAVANPYTNLTSALVLEGQAASPAATTGPFTTTDQVRWLTLGGYAISPAIPSSAFGLTVQAKVGHTETFANPSQIAKLELLVRDSTDTTTVCSVNVPTSATSGAYTTSTVSLPSGCLSADALKNGSFKLRYQVTHATCGAPTPTCAAVTSALDGIQMVVNYNIPDRAAWNGADPASVTAAVPKVPGACIHDGDYGFGPTTGVQFVFGGNSHVQLRSGAWELCPNYSATHQEIVLYSVKNPSTGGGGGGGASLTQVPSAAAGANWNANSTSPANGTSINGSLATTQFSGSNGGTNRSITLSGLSPSAAIDAASTNLTVNVRVAHSESSTNRITQRTIDLQPAGGGTTLCSLNVNGSQSLTTQTIAVPAGCLTIARINQGVQFVYTVRYACSNNCNGNTTASLDGVELDLSWNPPVTTGSLAQASGCVTQVPYYNPTTHLPGYNGACALFQVAANPVGAAPRVAVFWGTVYAPSAALDVPVDVLTVPVFDRGVVARMLMLGYNVASNAQVPISSTPITANVPNNRRMTFTAKVNGRTVTTADVIFCDSTGDPLCSGAAAGAPKVLAWRVNR